MWGIMSGKGSFILYPSGVYKWDEIDIGARIWTIPADRMKADKEHRVPLSDDAVKLLESMRRNSDSQFLFLSPRGGIVTSHSVSLVIRDMHESAINASGKGYIDPKQNGIAATARTMIRTVWIPNYTFVLSRHILLYSFTFRP